MTSVGAILQTIHHLTGCVLAQIQLLQVLHKRLMKIIAELVALCCSHSGDSCSRGPAHCRVLSDSTGICLNYEGLQIREMKGMEGKKTCKARESQRHFCLTD